MKLYFYDTIKDLKFNIRSTLTRILIVALGVLFPVLVINLAAGAIGTGFVELEKIFIFLRTYTTDTGNAFYKLYNALTFIMLTAGAVVVLMEMLYATRKQNNRLKNYLLMGASVGQLVGITIIRNLIVYTLGIVLGGVMSVVVGLIVGTILNIEVVFSVNVLLIALVIYLAILVMVSVLVPVWTNVGQTRKK